MGSGYSPMAFRFFGGETICPQFTFVVCLNWTATFPWPNLLDIFFFSQDFSFGWQFCSYKLLACVIAFLCFELIMRGSLLN